MRVGLIDGDLRPNLMFGFNLELMKLAAALRKRNDYYELIIDNHKLFQGFSKFYYRSDFETNVPEKIIKTGIADVDGMAFRKKGYFNYTEEMEKIIPEAEIYMYYCEQLTKTKIAKARANNLLKGIHLRISKDGESVSALNIYDTPLKKAMVYVYDKNIFAVKDWGYAIKELAQVKGGSYISFKVPQVVRGYQDFVDLAQSPLSAQKTQSYLIDLNMPNDDFKELAKESIPSRFEFICFEDSDVWTESKKRSECMKIFQRILTLQSSGHTNLLKYKGCSSPDGFDILINYLVIWSNLLSTGQIDCNFGKFVTTPHEKRTLFYYNARDLRDKVYNKYPEFQRFFFVNPLDLKRKGEVFKP